MLDEIIGFLVNQFLLLPLIIFVLWRKYKTGSFFPYDAPKKETAKVVLSSGAILFGLMAMISFWFSFRVYGIVFVVLSLGYILGIYRSMYRNNL